MRRMLPSDLHSGAVFLLALPVDDWPEKAREMVFHAHAADKYRQRLKKAHPLWGNGTLSAITSKNRYKRIPNKTDYLRALKCVIKAVEEMQKSHRPNA